jgi:predicted Zn-dependent protease
MGARVPAAANWDSFHVALVTMKGRILKQGLYLTVFQVDFTSVHLITQFELTARAMRALAQSESSSLRPVLRFSAAWYLLNTREK